MTIAFFMTISIQNAMLLHVLGLFVLAFVAYIITIIRDQAVAWDISRHKLGSCTKCGLVFLSKRQAQMPECPRCAGRAEPYLNKKTHSPSTTQ
ncbi:hypothetical protein [Oligosphaera ethanolica]|jgi:uncharacterized paraquat-inducible protein A|uniref:Paraquat-inducible protein A n=1 Tax=Oligosphaera ethanolica TaxID=760260 RepID=A0AAE4AN31_9BACT|nr:hypothetical protein [Oligosphaera ethanolica]MDQ0289181.1 putative paraquat-inducible protein A [Oligosphaera ethanolica]